MALLLGLLPGLTQGVYSLARVSLDAMIVLSVAWLLLNGFLVVGGESIEGWAQLLGDLLAFGQNNRLERALQLLLCPSAKGGVTSLGHLPARRLSMLPDFRC